MIDCRKAKQEFEHYLDQFDRSDEKIHLKIVHTEGVIRCMSKITKRMHLSQEDRDLAELIALLHDIGRFEQLRLYDSFEPAVMDHAAYGVQLLFDAEEPMIRKFVKDDTWDEIIRESIARHSDFSAGESSDERLLMHVRLIRDADKLDNCRVKLEESLQVLLGMPKEEVGSLPITDQVWQSCLSHQAVLLKDRITRMDYWVSYVAYFFDINFKETAEIILEEHYIDRIIDRIPCSNPDTKEKMELLRQETKAHLENMITGVKTQI